MKFCKKATFWSRCFLRCLCLALALLLMLLTGCTKPPEHKDGNEQENKDGNNLLPAEPNPAGNAPHTLKVNLLEHAFGVDRSNLRFSWVMQAQGNDQKQAAYRIVIASSAENMAAQAYLYDSGWVDSAQNTSVSVAALAAKLRDNTLYYWSVATRDTNGNESDLSAPQPFSTAVGKAWADTAGIWASADNGDAIVAPTSSDWSDYTVDVEFIIDSNALGFALRAKDAANFYMWQFKVDGGKAMLYPHVFKDGSFVGNKAIYSVTVPSEVAFGIGDTVRARMVCEGDTVSTYLADESGDYILIDQGDMSAYGFAAGVVGMRTGGSEGGRVISMDIYNHPAENSILYRSAFAAGSNPFSKCSVTNGALTVPKGLSTANLLDLAVLEELVGSGSDKSGDDFVFLRTELSLSEEQYKRLDRAILSVSATSPENTRQFVYNMYVNGSCVGVGHSRLGTTPDQKVVLYYNTYDITDLLGEGANALAAINYTTVGRAFLCQLTLHYSDGSSEIVLNSARDAAQWKSLAADDVFGNDNSIGTNYYTAHANNIDSALYPHGFATTDFDDATWSAVSVGDSIAAGKELLPSQTDNVTRYESDPAAIAVSKQSDGSYVIDLGREIVGGVRFTADLPASAQLQLSYGEQLNEDGSVRSKLLATNSYTETWQLVKGKQSIETIDMLTYRYLQISGCPIEITPDMVRGLEIRAAYNEEESAFTSDNSLLNDIYELMNHTVKVTTQDLYVDSQSRERLAYEGDLIINLLAAHAFEDDYSIGRFTAEYLYTHRTWPAEYYLFTAMFALDDYMATGDSTSLTKYYDILTSRNYTDRIHSDYGLLTTNNTKSSSTDAVLVDWPGGERDGYDMNATYNTVLNASAVLAYDNLSQIATALGKTNDAKEFSDLANGIRSAMIEHLYDSDKGAFADGLNADGTPSEHFSQHATAFALACGIYTDQAMADRLAATIDAQGEIRMSVYGAYFLLKGLYDSGNGDIANKLLLDTDTSESARTWAKMLYTLDATITTEAWGEKNKNNMTFSHPWGAAPAYAIKNGIFGINPTSAGYDTFDIRFQTAGIDSATLTVPTIKGSITAAFEENEGGYHVALRIPANTAATVYIPAKEGATLTVEGNGSALSAYENGYFKVEIGSGDHSFTVK